MPIKLELTLPLEFEKTTYQLVNIQGNKCSPSDHVHCLKCVGVGGEAMMGKPVPEMACIKLAA